jgi:predicted helicase
MKFDAVQPDRNQNWINLTNNDWDSLTPIADKKSKSWTSASQDRAIFRLVSNGLQTKRDDWAYDFDRKALEAKVKWLVEQYEVARRQRQIGGDEIKWDADLSRHPANNVAKTFDEKVDYSRHVSAVYEILGVF